MNSLPQNILMTFLKYALYDYGALTFIRGRLGKLRARVCVVRTLTPYCTCAELHRAHSQAMVVLRMRVAETQHK